MISYTEMDQKWGQVTPRSALCQSCRAQKDSRAKKFDGVLTLGLFRRVFIAHADHYAVLEPW